MTRFDVNADPITRLDFAATDFLQREQPRQPNPRPTAAECAECPPHRWDVTYTALTVEERCVKCTAERSRPRFVGMKQLTGRAYHDVAWTLDAMAKAGRGE